MDREHRLLYQKEYRGTHDNKQYQKEYRRKNKDHLRQMGIEWRKKNKEKIRAYKQRPDIKERDRKKQKEIRSREGFNERANELRKTPEKQAKIKEYCAKPEVKERTREHCRDWWERNKLRLKPIRKEYKLKTSYGLSMNDYLAMLQAQNNCCASCGTSSWGKHGPHVDHDHITGTVRGLLCNWCNAGAGFLDDNPEKIRKLADYLERYKF